jgi:hypothetical protein
MTTCFKLVLIALGSIWGTGGITTPWVTSIDTALARQYFDEIKSACVTDAGRLWGVNLYGPTMFVDPDNRAVVANHADNAGLLTAGKDIYTGNLPPEINIANTALEWSGTYWTMVDWNAISDIDPYDRKRLLIHESWHRIQEEIGIPSVTTANACLDNASGRIMLLLEFRALAKALLADDASEKKKAGGDALTFRKFRQHQFPDNNENAFERHEGMAEYTGLKLCGLADSLLVVIAAQKIQLGENNTGLANSFAYLTGPALGLLLDQYGTDWRAKVRAGADLPDLLAAAIEWHEPPSHEALSEAVDSAGIGYDITKLLNYETARAQRAGLTAEVFRNRLHEHGRLLILNNNLNFSFNPQEKLETYDTIGVIYKTMRLTGDFGVLEATNGILRTNDWQFFIVAAPDKVEDSAITGIEYTLQLNSGWRIAEKGKGIFIIEKK